MRQSSLYIDIWRDPDFASLSMVAKLLVIYCIVNPNKKLLTCYRLTDREIMFDLNIKPSDLVKLKEEIKKVNIFLIENYCIVKSQYSFNKFKGKLLENAMNKELQQLPENIVELTKSDTLSIPYRYPIDRVNNNNSNNNNNNNNNQKETKQILEVFNRVTGKDLKSSLSWEKNFKRWRLEYSLEEIIRAIENMKHHKWFIENPTAQKPDVFFKTNKDWISDCLQVRKKKKENYFIPDDI